MADEQNPSLPDLMLPEYIPDPELLAREKAIYDRIMKSPSERAKERTAEMWNERYGVKPESGKLRRILAGIGEVARGIGAGAKYQSIPDMAREEVLKEYQAEVPNLNRELGVISAEKRAGAALAQKNAYQQNKLEQDFYVQQRRLGQTDEQIVQSGKLTRAKIDQIKANINLTESKTAGQNLTNDSLEMGNAVQRMFGGMKPTGDVANAYGFNQYGKANPQDATDMLALMKTQAALKNAGRAGASGGVTYDRVQSSRFQLVPGADGQLHKVELPVEKIYQRKIPGQVNLNLGETPGVSWMKQQPVATLPEGISQGEVYKNDKNETTIVPAVGTPYQIKLQAGNRLTNRVDPTHIDKLSSIFGIPKESFNNFSSTRWTDAVLPFKGKQAEGFQARENYRMSLEALTKAATNAYGKGETNNISGLWENFENNIKAMTGDLPLEAIQIRQLSVDLIANKILEMSGKAVTNQERNFLMKSLPNMSTDAPQTYVGKVMLLNNFMRTRQLFSAARLRDDEIERLYSTDAGIQLGNLAAAQFNALERLRKMAVNGEPFTFGGKVYKNYEEAAKKVANMGSTTTIATLFKQALKEAGINDAIPLK